MLNNSSFDQNGNEQLLDEAAFVDSFFLPGGILDDDTIVGTIDENKVNDENIMAIIGGIHRATTTTSSSPSSSSLPPKSTTIPATRTTAVTPSRNDLYSIQTIVPLDNNATTTTSSSLFSPWRSNIVDVTTPSPIQELLGSTTQQRSHDVDAFPSLPFLIPAVGGDFVRSSRLSDNSFVFTNTQQQQQQQHHQHLLPLMKLSAESPPFHLGSSASTGMNVPPTELVLSVSNGSVVAPPGFESSLQKSKGGRKPVWAEIASPNRSNAVRSSIDINQIQQQHLQQNSNDGKDERGMKVMGGGIGKGRKHSKSPDSSIGNDSRDSIRNRKIGSLTKKISNESLVKHDSVEGMTTSNDNNTSGSKSPLKNRLQSNQRTSKNKRTSNTGSREHNSLSRSPKAQPPKSSNVLTSDMIDLQLETFIKPKTTATTTTVVVEKSGVTSYQSNNYSKHGKAQQQRTKKSTYIVDTNKSSFSRNSNNYSVLQQGNDETESDVFDDMDDKDDDFVVVTTPSRRLVSSNTGGSRDDDDDDVHVDDNNNDENTSYNIHPLLLVNDDVAIVESVSDRQQLEHTDSTACLDNKPFAADSRTSLTVEVVEDNALHIENDNMKQKEKTSSILTDRTDAVVVSDKRKHDGFIIRYISHPISILISYIITIYYSIGIVLLAIANIFKFASDESTSYSIGGIFWASPSVLCYYVFCLMPIVCNWLMTYIGNLPHFTPHVLSNVSVYLVCRMLSQVSTESTQVSLQQQIQQQQAQQQQIQPQQQRRKLHHNTKLPNHSSSSIPTNNSNCSCSSSNNFNTSVLTDFGNDICQIILQIVKLVLPLLFFIEGFTQSNSSFMLLDAHQRMIIAYILSLVKRGLILSPISWIGWSIQILLSSFIPSGSILNALLFFIGLAFIRLVSLIQQPSQQQQQSIVSFDSSTSTPSTVKSYT